MHIVKALVVSLVLFSPQIFADSEPQPLAVGDNLTLPELTDQFDNKQGLKPDTTWVVFSHDMDGGDIVDLAFAELDDEKLEAAGVQYYADISGMPGLISRFMAIPNLKELPYSMVLGRESKDLAQFPRQESQVSLLKLSGGELVSVEYIDDPAVLRGKVFPSAN
jgi:hypothetical protein